MFTQSLPAAADVVVIGAGVVGACCGYELSARGLTVAVVDRGPVGGGATALGGAGHLAWDKHPGPALDLAMLSRRRWHELPDTLAGQAASIGLADTGALAVARTEETAKALHGLATEQRGAGLTVEDVEPAAVRELEPRLTHEIAAAAFYPDAAQVRPVLAATALLTAAVSQGATVTPGAEVSSITTDGDGLAVRTGAGTVRAGNVVLAAGPWSGRLAAMLGRTLPIEQRQWTLVETEPLPPVVHHLVYDARQVGADEAPEPGSGPASGVTLEPTGAGSVLIGSVRPQGGSRLPVSAMRGLAASALSLFPALGDARALHTHGGRRPCTPDQLPVIGRDPQIPALWYATGHGSDGPALAPGTAMLIGELLTRTAPSLDPTPFAASRSGLSAAATSDTTGNATPPGPETTSGPGSMP